MRAISNELLLLATVLTIIVGASPSNAQANKPPEHIVFAYSSENLAHIPLYVAKEKGFFAEEGLDVDLRHVGAGNYYPAMFSGDVQLAGSNLTDGMLLKEQGKQVVSLAAYGQNLAEQFVLSKAVADKAGITDKSTLDQKVAALRGTTIAPTGKGASTDFALRFLLAKHGLDYQKDLNVTYIKEGPAMLAALKAGRIDGFINNAPWWQLAVNRYNAMVFVNFSAGEVPELRGYVQYSIVVEPKTLKERRPMLEKFLRALVRGERFSRDPANLDEISNIALKYVGDGTTSKEDVRSLFDAILQNNMIPENPLITQQGFDANKNFYNAIRQMEGQPLLSAVYADTINTDLITKVLAELDHGAADAK